MRNPQLELHDLVFGLERFGDRYEAIDVFADDVLEARPGRRVAGVVALDSEGRRFCYLYEGRPYEVELVPQAGVIRLSRSKQPAPPSPEGTGGALAGAMTDATVAAASGKKGEDSGGGLILGLLAGATPGSLSAANPPRRVFTMQFDPTMREWHAYDGGLVPWMKENLLQRSA